MVEALPCAKTITTLHSQRPDRNTVGNVPLEWYKDEEHIGYTKDGKKIIKQKRKDRLDAFLRQADDPKAW